jgi:hypothetical protein
MIFLNRSFDLLQTFSAHNSSNITELMYMGLVGQRQRQMEH